MAVKKAEKMEKVIVYDVKEFDKILYSRVVRAISGKAKLLPIDDLEEWKSLFIRRPSRFYVYEYDQLPFVINYVEQPPLPSDMPSNITGSFLNVSTKLGELGKLPQKLSYAFSNP